MTSVLMRRREDTHRNREDDHLKTEVEIEVIQLQARDIEDGKGHQTPGERHWTESPSWPPGEIDSINTLILNVWPSEQRGNRFLFF